MFWICSLDYSKIKDRGLEIVEKKRILIKLNTIEHINLFYLDVLVVRAQANLAYKLLLCFNG